MTERLRKAAEGSYELMAMVNMKDLHAPDDEQVAETLDKIKEILSKKELDYDENASVKDGYTHVVYILENRIIDVSAASISDLETMRGRSIAGLAISYLRGYLTQETLVNVPIKRM